MQWETNKNLKQNDVVFDRNANEKIKMQSKTSF